MQKTQPHQTMSPPAMTIGGISLRTLSLLPPGSIFRHWRTQQHYMVVNLSRTPGKRSREMVTYTPIDERDDDNRVMWTRTVRNFTQKVADPTLDDGDREVPRFERVL